MVSPSWSPFLRRSWSTMDGGGLLIGRERELVEVERMLASARLVTVTGAGGCGKTRLSLEVAERAVSSAQHTPAVVIEVAGAASAEQLVDAALRAVGARERVGRRPSQVLLEHLAERRLLLVFDNCEHLAAEVGRVVRELLDGAPGLRALVASREPLGIAGEDVFRLGPLSLPEPGGGVGAVVRSDAARLFVDRAAAADAGFALTPAVARAVARICHQLDGLPLALCLAAARVGAVSVSEVAEGLTRRGRLDTIAADGGSPHHHSVRASFDWSYQLLEARERELLRWLSVFAGGFTVASAHAVAGPLLDEGEVRRLLDSLEAKGLIMAVTARGPERWAFLETIREQAFELLCLESEQDEAEDRRLVFFRAFAATADELVLETDGHEVIDEETANLRRALEWALERDIDGATDMVADLMNHWVLAEHFEEGRAACAAVLAATPGGDPGGRAVVHCGAGMIGMLSGDYAGAIANTQAGLALLEAVGDVEAQVRCLRMSAMVLTLTGIDMEQGRRNAYQAAELARCNGDWLGTAWALSNLAVVEATSDRFDAARTAYEEFLTIPNASEHVRLRTFAEVAAAWIEVIAGSPERALAHADLALALEGDWPSMTHFQIAGFRIHALALLGRTEEALSEGAREMSTRPGVGGAPGDSGDRPGPADRRAGRRRPRRRRGPRAAVARGTTAAHARVGARGAGADRAGQRRRGRGRGPGTRARGRVRPNEKRPSRCDRPVSLRRCRDARREPRSRPRSASGGAGDRRRAGPRAGGSGRTALVGAARGADGRHAAGRSSGCGRGSRAGATRLRGVEVDAGRTGGGPRELVGARHRGLGCGVGGG